MSDDMPEWASELRAGQEKLSAQFEEILTLFNGAVGQISPIIDQLANHPMAKMLGVKR